MKVSITPWSSSSSSQLFTFLTTIVCHTARAAASMAETTSSEPRNSRARSVTPGLLDHIFGLVVAQMVSTPQSCDLINDFAQSRKLRDCSMTTQFGPV
jgi:hypothetical protein